jgi:putative permease
MTKNSERAQLFLFFFVVIFLIAVFFVTPSLQIISLLTLLNVLFLSPLVKFLESKKIHRIFAILIVFLVSGAVVGLFISWITNVAITQWTTLAQSLPSLSDALLGKLHEVELYFQQRFHFEFEFGLSSIISQAGTGSTTWLVSHATTLISGIASAAILVPIFSFFILKDAEEYKKELLKLVPKQYYSGIVTTIEKTAASLSKFLRAKAVEASLVSLLTYIGLLIYDADYAAILALVAGITNVLPYIGPVLGIIPAVALLGFHWPIFLIYGIVNTLDMIVIFPVLVGKLVNLSPLTLLVAVAVGQELYGLIGMLISVPVASSIKIIYQQVVEVLYSTEG